MARENFSEFIRRRREHLRKLKKEKESAEAGDSEEGTSRISRRIQKKIEEIQRLTGEARELNEDITGTFRKLPKKKPDDKNDKDKKKQADDS